MKETMAKAFAKAKLTLAKYAPEILVVSGVVGLIGAGVLACTETAKLDEVLAKGDARKEELMDKLNKVDEGKEQGVIEEDAWTEKDEKAAVVQLWAKNAFDVVKLYAPSVLLAVASATAILGGFNILKKRHIALTAAFGEMALGFTEFKKRTKEAVGEEKYNQILNGIEKELKEVVNDEGEVVVAEVTSANPVKDPYTFVWDETTSLNYKLGNLTDNETFLEGLQAAFNERLRALRGYVFLNDVLEELGLPKTSAGQQVGWVMQPNDSHEGDNYIDFGIEYVDDMNKETMKFTRRYILHFNCDGYILDKFEDAYKGDK